LCRGSDFFGNTVLDQRVLYLVIERALYFCQGKQAVTFDYELTCMSCRVAPGFFCS